MANAPSGIRDGEFVQSVYDTINTNKGEFWQLPLYGKSNLFAKAAALNMPGGAVAAVDEEAGLGNYPYIIKRYIYCTVKGFSFWEPGTPWIGYIAESNEEETKRLGCRDIVVAIRGTIGSTEWIKNFTFAMSHFPFVQEPVSGARVHRGFLSIYTSTDPTLSSFGKKSMRDQICDDLLERLDNTVPVRITFAGHSLGGALATMAACDVGCNVAPRFTDVKVSAVTFASPKVGNDAFKWNAEKHAASLLRYRNIGDIVPSLPPSSWFYPYVHVGTELTLDWARSPYVKSISIAKWKCHSLELHMHVMAAEAVNSASELEELLAGFTLAPRGSSYVIEDLCQMAAWEDEDRDLIRRELEDARNSLTEDQAAMEAYLREIYYIAVTRAPIKEKEVGGRDMDGAGAASPSPFDNRDCSLLNKSGDLLKEEYNVPARWLLHPNKDMVQDSVSNKWLPRVKRSYDIPSADNTEYN